MRRKRKVQDERNIQIKVKSMTREKLIRKYNVPVPRYTSYPTVPFWDTDHFSIDAWRSSVKRCFDESNHQKGIAAYIHLPFCESLCTYCACNTRITKNHHVEEKYINSVLQEWDMYCQLFGPVPVIRELHLGGGTPTFFKPENLKRLINGICVQSLLHPDFEFSFEGHPNNTTEEHLRVLHNVGFRRVSFGVQDLDPVVQKAINRVQPLENVQHVTAASRKLGYESISFDLVYGLPFQTSESVINTMQRVIELEPDRIAFYSYAHVPWLKPGQRGYKDADLPTDQAKRNLYESGQELLTSNGYIDIGMDHFAKPTDSLAEAQINGKLHRNFMGYTTSEADLLIGLGASSISDAKYAYAQNTKKVEEYHEQVQRNQLAIFKGHIQTDDDLVVKKSILELACNGHLPNATLSLVKDSSCVEKLEEMSKEGLLEFSPKGLTITPEGKAFIRNICSVFDLKLRTSVTDSQPIFSKSI